MVNCVYTPIDEIAFFRSVVAEKRKAAKALLNPISGRIEAAYLIYLNDFPILCAQPDSSFVADSNAVRATLQQCYSVGTQTFIRFKANYFESQPPAVADRCPYCMIESPYTIDHYIGQSEFPEFSILTKNLLPCCWKCNHQKNDDWRHLGLRTFINFYNDLFLQFSFLSAQLFIPAGSTVPIINYLLIQPAEINHEQFALVTRHFNALNLLVKYNKKAIPKLSTEIQTTLRLIALGWTDENIRIMHLESYNSLCNLYGVNFWESLIPRLLSENVQMIRNLQY